MCTVNDFALIKEYLRALLHSFGRSDEVRSEEPSASWFHICLSRCIAAILISVHKIHVFDLGVRIEQIGLIHVGFHEQGAKRPRFILSLVVML